MKPKKILGWTDYGKSGLAYTLRHPLRHWHEQGHEVWLYGKYYDGNIDNVDRSIYPYAERIIKEVHGAPEELANAIATLEPDIVISGIDLWMMDWLTAPGSYRPYESKPPMRHLLGHETRHFLHCAYFPLDNLLRGGFLGAEIEQAITAVDLPICFSQDGHDAVLRSTGLDIPYIPLPIETGTYYRRDRESARQKFGFGEDDFVVAMVATNQWRKLWGEFAEVMGRVTKRHANVRVVPWTPLHAFSGGFDLADLMYRNDLGDFIIYPQQVGHATDDEMAEFYSAIDLLVLTTAAEGAGLPPLHARACGTAALVSHNTANGEFAAAPFELIPTAGSGLIHGYVSPKNTVVYTTDLDILEERIERLYTDRALLRSIGDAGIRAMQAYAPAKILPLWDKVLDALSSR